MRLLPDGKRPGCSFCGRDDVAVVEGPAVLVCMACAIRCTELLLTGGKCIAGLDEPTASDCTGCPQTCPRAVP